MAGWRLYKWVTPFETQEECQAVVSSLSKKLGYFPKSDPIVSIREGELIKIEVAAWDRRYVQANYASQHKSYFLRRIKLALGEPEEVEDLLGSMPVRNYMGPKLERRIVFSTVF